MHLCMQPLKSVVKWKTKTSEIRAADVLKLCYQGQFNLIIRLENILKTSWRCLEYVFVRRLEYILKTPWRRFSKTSWKCLEEVLKTFCKTSWRRLEGVWPRWIYWSWSRRLRPVLFCRKGDLTSFAKFTRKHQKRGSGTDFFLRILQDFS